MKRAIVTSLTLALVVSLFTFSTRKQETNQVVMIRGYIFISLIGGKNLSTIKIYNGSSTVVTELGKISSKTAFDESMNEVVSAVNKYVSQGYKIQGFTEVPGSSVVVLNYTLTK